MRKSLISMFAVVLAFSSSVGAVTIRAGDNSTNIIFIAPETNQVIEVYAAGDGSDAFSAIGAAIKATIGDGIGSDPDPNFTGVNFGATTTIDPGDGSSVDVVLWHPDAPNAPAWDIPVYSDKEVDAGVVWVDVVKETALPAGPNPSDPASQTLIAELVIDVSPFTASTLSSVTSFGLDLSGSELVGPTPSSPPGATAPTSDITQNATLVISLGGDTNLDGLVSVVDLGTLRANLDGAGTWAQGDTNGDGQITVVDLGALRANLDHSVLEGLGGVPSVSSAPSVIPEPGSLGLLALGGLMVLGSRQGKKI